MLGLLLSRANNQAHRTWPRIRISRMSVDLVVRDVTQLSWTHIGLVPNDRVQGICRRDGVADEPVGVDPTVLSSAAIRPNSLKSSELCPTSERRDFEQKTHFVKSRLVNARQTRPSGGFGGSIRPAKCHK